jgi:anti-anti-sigma factor
MPVSFSIADSSDGPRKVVVWVTGDLDAETSRAVRARLGQAQRNPQSEVILDLSGVTYIDSVGITAILTGARALGDGTHMQVISPPDELAEALLDSGLGDKFEVVSDRRELIDRRRREQPVAYERRRGERRRGPGLDGDESVAEVENQVSNSA